MKDGRPLRFLGGTLVAWTIFRVAVLWPESDPVTLASLVTPPARAATAMPAAAPPIPMFRASAAPAIGRATRRTRSSETISDPAAARATMSIAVADHGLPIAVADHGTQSGQGALCPPLRPTPIARGAGRLAGSAWLLARGGPNGTVSGGRLGASQAGVRITYALGNARRVALAARIATPLAGRGKEAAIGLDWQPTRLPFHLIAEQRFVLDGGKGGPTIGIIGGYGPGMVAPGVRIEAYGQAGAIARDGVEGFVDAAARATHPVTARGPVRIDIGAGVWGSAQRGAARFDIGPTVGMVIPVEKRVLRLALDWRERVAGNARPGSGPAFTIGSDF